MYNFFATIDALNQSYVEQLKFFWVSIPTVTNQTQKRTEWVLSLQPQKEWERKNSPSSILDFPKIPPHRAQAHWIEDDDISYVDFPHHRRMSEEAYREYAWHELDIHFDEIVNDYKHNFFIITRIFPRYLKRYWRFLDKYLMLLEQPELNTNQAHHISKNWNVFSPWKISSEKKDRDTLLQTLQHMEQSWESEKILLIHGFENMYQACLRNERYWSLIWYNIPTERPEVKDVKWILEKIAEDKVAILELIWAVNQVTLHNYKNWTPEFRMAEHIKIQANLCPKKIPTK